MTNNAYITSETGDDRTANRPRLIPRLSPLLAASAVGLFAIGVAVGWGEYLHRSLVREAHVPGTSAWPVQFALAAAACVLCGVARWRHRRRFGRRSGRLLLLAPLGRSAAARLITTMRQVSWRTVAALAPMVGSPTASGGLASR